MPDGVPKGDAAVEQWLYHRFAVEKEALLEHFEAHKTFPGPELGHPANPLHLWGQVCLLMASFCILLWAIQAWLGNMVMLLFSAVGAVAGVFAATGDSNPALNSTSMKPTKAGEHGPPQGKKDK